MQAASDIFLGWNRGLSGTQYYWRQLKDMKGSFDVTRLKAKGLGAYLGVCSACLARAHARTGDAAAIYGYLGGGDVFDQAISNFALSYADQTKLDHQALMDAVNKGQIVAETGI
jgi:predicted alpha/beta hydrolase